ncbi:MAG: alpha/beta hydrolase fold protein [Thermoleophilia bacterium]|nr:alpha/beta hydrolase fold protein [Thermoleophilia bacterium]
MTTAEFTPAHRGGSGPPLVLVHGFMDTWRTWELVLPALEARHDVLAPTLPGHAGGPAITGAVTDTVLVDAVEAAMDRAGFETAHVVGNSLGGHVALQLAERGRARSVVAFAPGGGWGPSDTTRDGLLDLQRSMHAASVAIAPYAERALSSPEGRARATRWIVEDASGIPVELLVHQVHGVAACSAASQLIDHARVSAWPLDAERVTCPVRFVWGVEDRLLPWPTAAARLRAAFPHAEWVELDGVGHCPQLEVPLEASQLVLDVTG